MTADLQPETSITQRRAWSVGEAGAIYGLSNGFVRGLIRNGKLRARRVGRRVLILDTDLVEFFKEQAGQFSRRPGADLPVGKA